MKTSLFTLIINKIYNRFFIRKVDNKQSEWEKWDERMNKKIEKLKKNEFPQELKSPIEMRYYSKLIRQLKELTGFDSFKGLKTIEFGCGTGLLSLSMAKEGAQSTLVDFSDFWVKYSKILYRFMRKEKFLGNARWVKADFFELRNIEGKFDISHSIGVIEHYGDKKAIELVTKMAESTKKGGCVIIGVPNFWSIDLINIWRVYGKGNKRYFSKTMVRNLLKNGGLKNIIVTTSTFFYPSFIPEKFIKKTKFIEDFCGKYLKLGFLIIGIGRK